MRRGRLSAGAFVRHVVLALFAVVTLFPVAWVLLLSVKTNNDANQNEIWPRTFDFNTYKYSMSAISTVALNYWNSVYVTASTVVITTVCAVLAAYALVFLRTRGMAVVMAFFIASMFFPTRITAIISIWEIQKNLGLLNVPAGLILPYVSLALVVSVFVMRGMFLSVPREIVDAARIDGAGPIRILLTILTPLVKNGIIVVIIINFGVAWGEYLLARTLNSAVESQTLPVALASSVGGRGAWNWNRSAAVYVMSIAPGLIVFALVQRWYVKGLQEGALKV